MEIDYFRYMLIRLRDNDYKIDDVCDVLNYFLPRDNNSELLVGYNIYDKGRVCNYDINMNVINISIDYVRLWIDKNKNIFYNFNMDVKNNKYFYEYMFIFAIVHEVMHSYQYLIANRFIDSPSIFMRDGYKGLIDTFLYTYKDNLNNVTKIKMFISNWIYLMNSNKFVLERNANVEGCMLLRDISYELGDLDISIMFNNAMNNQLLSGYINNNDGSFKETYKKMFIINKYNMLIDDNNIPVSDRIRYGLEVDKDIDVKKLILRNNIY